MLPISELAPLLGTSTPVQLDADYKTEAQIHRAAKNEDGVDCHTGESRGRRLFPQHRHSVPTSVSCNANAISAFPHLEFSPLWDHSPVDHKENDSNTSSPSSDDSVATVQVHVSPNPDRPFLETDPRIGDNARVRTPCVAGSFPGSYLVERPITPSKSSIKDLETNFSAALYTDTPARGNLQWKSMAQFHKSGLRLRTGNLSQLPNSEQTLRDSNKSREPHVPTIDAVADILPRGIDPCQWRRSTDIMANPKLSSTEAQQDWKREKETYVITEDQNRPDVPAVTIATWDCTVELSTVVTIAGNGKLHVHHLALVSIIMPVEETQAEKVSLSFVVANALRTDHKRSLGPGQSSLLFRDDVSKTGFFPRESVELNIVRDSCDLEKPLSLYFAFTCATPRDFVEASLPTFRPKEGRSVSEAVFIAEPLPPLSMRTSIRDSLSNWKLLRHPVSQVTCYQRTNLPQCYPTSFQDDITMRILELDPVIFRALGESTISRVVWKLDIMIDEIPEEHMECRMSFFLEVGAARALVSLVPHGWTPRYFIVDGRVATEKFCWKNKDGHITIFKQDHVSRGQIMVETYWQGPPRHGKHDGRSIKDPSLPRIADRRVLGGRLTCQANEIILLNHLGERIRPLGPVDWTNTVETLLPTMDAGYRILLNGVTKTPSQEFCHPVSIHHHSKPIPDDTPLREHDVFHSDAGIKTEHESDMDYPANDAMNPPRHLLQALILPFLFLLLFVPGSLLFVEHVRSGNNYDELTYGRDQDPSTMIRDWETLQAIIDVADSDLLQPAVGTVDNPVEVLRCEGWRDWVDYGSGWKGCVP